MLDERMFVPGAFLSRKKPTPRLVEVLSCREAGKTFPRRQRALTVENSKTLCEELLLESELRQYSLVKHTCSNPRP